MSTPWWTSYFSFNPRRIAMVSSTEGSSTRTFWKRRSSAASFSMYLRYSSTVVAPEALDHAADFLVAADHGVELALPRPLGEVDGVFLERLALAFLLGMVDRFAAAHGLDGVLESRRIDSMLLEKPAGIALVLGGGEQEQLRGDELVAPLRRLLVGEVEEVVQVAGDRDLPARALDFGEPLDRVFERFLQRRDVHAGALQERGSAAVLLVEEREQQVLRLDEAVVVGQRLALGVGEGLLELCR